MLNLIILSVMMLFMILVFFMIKYMKDSLSRSNEEKINALRMEWSDTLHKNTQLIVNQLNENSKLSQESNSSLTKTFGEVQKSLGQLDEKTQAMFEIGKDIASLQEILKAPKMRGGLGEMFLENLLSQIMPSDEFYTLQYGFISGERVDAVINIGKKLVPVDSKFPLESFKRLVEASSEDDKKRFKKEFVRSVKEHIDSIASKYILPEENTYDFALMYIPAENVYYESIIKDDDITADKSIFSHAISKKVIPVSPNSFYAYLQVIIMGIRGLKIEEKTQEVINRLSGLKTTFSRFSKEFEIVGTHIQNAQKKYSEADKALAKFENRLDEIGSIDTKKALETKDQGGA